MSIDLTFLNITMELYETDKYQLEDLFKDIKPILCDILEPDMMELVCEEMNKSFDTGIFQKRKEEYLQKINLDSINIGMVVFKYINL